MQARIRRVGIAVFPEVQTLDVVGPADALAAAGGYETVLIGLHRRAVRSESGVRLSADATIAKHPALDTLIITGGRGIRLRPEVQRAFGGWARRQSGQVRRLASVCTGTFGLAASGLLDGRRVTTHWRYAAELARAYPRLHVEPDAIYIRDGKFYSSAGVTASIDLTLALIEEDRGAKTALEAARALVVYMKRAGGQEQYSAPLRLQERAPKRLAEMAGWMACHLHEDLSVERMAERARLSPRQFNRVFLRAFGEPPARFVEKLRLDDARRLLGEPDGRVSEIAAAVGFASSDVFRRAFERRYGLAPSAFRGRFNSSVNQ